MAVNTPLEVLEVEEREARMRLAAYRDQHYADDAPKPPGIEQRLRELEHAWKAAADRLHQARVHRRAATAEPGGAERAATAEPGPAERHDSTALDP
jgi:hypothetical protein